MVSVVLITVLDCMTIAAAMPMQMTSSIMLQTGMEKKHLGPRIRHDAHGQHCFRCGGWDALQFAE